MYLLIHLRSLQVLIYLCIGCFYFYLLFYVVQCKFLFERLFDMFLKRLFDTIFIIYFYFQTISEKPCQIFLKIANYGQIF
jgi:hypothetical protein